MCMLHICVSANDCVGNKLINDNNYNDKKKEEKKVTQLLKL